MEMNFKNLFCANCHGPIEIFLNRKDVGGETTSVPLPKTRAFTEFVQVNYKEMFKEGSGMSHVDVMEKLRNKFGKLPRNK